MILAHAKDAYLYGYAAETRIILQEYQDLLTTYMNLPQWNALNPQWRSEFEQMHQEIVAILHRIDNGFDFFGNPPNWTPMLSFEALRTAYERETDLAIRILYLSYWLQNKADDLSSTLNALTNGRQTLWTQAEQFRYDYEINAALIGPLTTEAANITAAIGTADHTGCSGLLCQLKQKEAALLKQADKNVHPEWKKWLGLISSVVTSSGTDLSRSERGGWWGAGIGLGIGVLTAATDTLLAEDEIISNRTDVVQQFNSIQFDDATNNWLQNANMITDVTDIENDGAQKYLDTLKDSAGQMADALYDVKQALMETAVDDKQVDVELKKLKAEDPQFNKLVDQAVLK